MTSLERSKQLLSNITRIVAILMSLFHFVTAAMGSLPTMQQRSVHVGFTLMLIFLQSALKKDSKGISFIVNILMVILSLIGSLYILKNWYYLAMRVAFPDSPDLVIGAILLILTLEATRRKLGWPLPIIAGLFIIYGFIGAY